MSETLNFDGSVNGQHIRIEVSVREASIRDSYSRTMYQIKAKDQELDPGDQLGFLRLKMYPDMMAVSSGSFQLDGEERAWPPTFEEFLELPEKFGIQWEMTVYRLNPGWRIGGDGNGEKKQSTTGSNGSTESTEASQTKISQK